MYLVRLKEKNSVEALRNELILSTIKLAVTYLTKPDFFSLLVDGVTVTLVNAFPLYGT